MIRSEKMSLITIYLNRELISLFIQDIIKVKNFHLKKSIKEDDRKGSKLKGRKKLGIFSEEEIKNLKNKITLAKNYTKKIKKLAKVNQKERIIPIEENRMSITYKNPEEYVDRILLGIEKLNKKINKMSKKLEKLDYQMEEIAEIASLLNISLKFGGQKFTQGDFKRLHFDFFVTSSTYYSEFKIASEQLKSPIVCYGEEVGLDITGFFIFYEAEFEKMISDLLLSYHCQKIQIPDIYFDDKGINIDRIQKDHDDILLERNELALSYENWLNNLTQIVMGYEEAVINATIIIGIIGEIEQTPSYNIIKIEGFIPTNIEVEVVKALQLQFNENIKIELKHFEQEDPYDEKENESNDEINAGKPPTLLKPNFFAKPFKSLIDMYGAPNYSEIDPSIYVALSFPLIFGLMFGDVGHGLSLIIAGLILVLKFKKKGKKVHFPLIIIYCGIGAILGGFVYGEFFGEHLIIGGRYIMLLGNPIYNVISVLKLSIFTGVIMLCLGWAIKFLNLVINKKTYLAIAGPLMKILMMLGGTRLIFSYYFDIYQWMVPSPVGFGLPAIFLVIIPAVFYIILKPIGKLAGISYLKHHKVGGIIFESIIDLAETLLQIISNISSFVRILALEMAHIALMIVVIELSNLVIPANSSGFDISTIFSFIILVLGNAFVIVLELLFALIHSLRLHYYEFFAKFYLGNGIPFEPIVVKKEYSTISFIEIPDIDNCFNFYCED